MLACAGFAENAAGGDLAMSYAIGDLGVSV